MDAAIATRGDDVPAVGREIHGEHLGLRLLQRVEPHAIRDAPELHGLVGAGRREDLSRRMPGEVEDGAVVHVDRSQERAVGHVPEFHRPVVSGGGQNRAIRRKFGVAQQVAVSTKRADHSAGAGIAHLRDAGKAGDTARHHERAAIGPEVHRHDPPRQVVERRHDRRAGEVASARRGDVMQLEGSAAGDGGTRAVG